MPTTFDSVFVSNDLSLDRVLNAGLPVAMIFFEKAMAPELRPTLDDLARQCAKRALIVMLPRSEAPQAMFRFGVRQVPGIVTVREGKPLSHQTRLKIAKVNVDENPGLAGKYGIMSIPTVIVFMGGREVDRWVGALPENALRSRIARWIQPERRAA
jgi:thioredoxin-like negative regulator of GroEL